MRTELLSATANALLRVLNGGGPEPCDGCGEETHALRYDEFNEEYLCRGCMEAAVERAENMYPPWQYWKAVRDDAE